VSQVTQLATGQITAADVLTIELVETRRAPDRSDNPLAGQALPATASSTTAKKVLEGAAGAPRRSRSLFWSPCGCSGAA
jgi:hypothetical protein